MNKKILLLFGIALLIFPLINAAICNDSIVYTAIPCEIITEATNCSTDAIISNIANTSDNSTRTMDLLIPGCTSNCQYNFTFNISTIADYQVSICNDRYSVIEVIAEPLVCPVYSTGGGGTTEKTACDLTEFSKRDQVKILSKNISEWIKYNLKNYPIFFVLILFLILLLIGGKKIINRNEKKK